MNDKPETNQSTLDNSINKKKEVNPTTLALVGVTTAIATIVLFAFIIYPFMAKQEAQRETRATINTALSTALENTNGVKVDVHVSATGNNLFKVISGEPQVKKITVDINNINIDAKQAEQSSATAAANTVQLEEENKKEAEQLLRTISENVDIIEVKLGKINVTNIPNQKDVSINFNSSSFSLGRSSYSIDINLSKTETTRLINQGMDILSDIGTPLPSSTPPSVKLSNGTITITYDNETLKLSAQPVNNGRSIKYSVESGGTSISSTYNIPVEEGKPYPTVTRITLDENSSYYIMGVAGQIMGVDNNLWEYLLKNKDTVFSSVQNEESSISPTR